MVKLQEHLVQKKIEDILSIKEGGRITIPFIDQDIILKNALISNN